MQTKGIVTIITRDANTLEVKRTQENFNVFNNWVNHFFNMRPGFNFTRQINSSNQVHDVIYMSTSPVNGGNSFMHKLGLSPNSTVSGTFLTESFTDATMSTPAFYETSWRFQPPTSGTRTIPTILIGDTQNASQATAYVEVSPACTQDDTEILDITYRIQVFESTNASITNFERSDRLEVWAPRWIGNPDVGVMSIGRPANGIFHWVDIPEGFPYSNFGFNPARTDASAAGNESIYDGQYKIHFDKTFDEGTNVGHIFRSVLFGFDRAYSMWMTATPDDFPNKPVQPIHNHNANAADPFLDVHFLASGSGKIEVEGSSWTNTDFPEFGRIDISQTGDVGSAKYFFRTRKLFGFEEGNASSSSYLTNKLNSFPWFRDRRSFENNPYDDPEDNTTFHGPGNFPYGMEEYEAPNLIVHELQSQGCTLINLDNGKYHIFSPTSTPAVNCTSLSQVQADNSGNLWIACRNNGLFKVADPLGSPTVTHFSQGTHGIPANGGCFGVAEGYNNSIWAMFDGGLSTTTDGGSSWTNYDPLSVPAFDYTTNGGITNGNWSTVKFIRVDRESPNNDIGIVYENVNDNANVTRAYFAWWNTQGTSFDGPNFDDVNHSTGNHIPTRFRCSYRGSLWYLARTPTTASRFEILEFGSNTSTSLTNTGALPGLEYEQAGAAFWYDIYGNPYVLGEGTVGTGSGCLRGGKSLFNKNGEIVVDDVAGNSFSCGDSYGHTGIMFTWEKDPNGVVIRNDFDNGSVGISGPSSNFTKPDHLFPRQNLVSNPVPLDPLNGKNTVLREFAWDEYRWNGSSWEKDYHNDAVDTSGNSLDGARRGFEVEDHTFRGRSKIDASVVATSSPVPFSTEMTFVVSITPDTKPAGQEPKIVLFDLFDKSTENTLTFFWNDGVGSSDQIMVDDGTTQTQLASTPATGGTYRVVFILDGTNVDVYIDDVQQGTTVAVTNVPDLTNPSGDLNVNIGAKYQGFYGFAGQATNAQIWNVAWTPVDVSNDNGNPSGVIGSQPGTSLIARYELTQTLDESKVMDGGSPAVPESIPLGLTATFSSTGASPHFVQGDYYTFGIVDGILKDNAISFSSDHEIFWNAVDHNVTDVEDTLHASGPVIPSTGGQIVEKVAFIRSDDDRFTGLGYGFAGEDNASITGFSFQSMTGEGYFEFIVDGGNDSIMNMGLTTSKGSTTGSGTYRVSLGRNVEDLIATIIHDGSIIMDFPNPVVAGDTVRISRNASNIISYFHNGVSVYSDVTPVPGILYGLSSITAGGISDAVMDYTRPAYILDLGDSSGSTGKYDPNFSGTMDHKVYDFTIDGSPASSVTVETNLSIDEVSPPGPNEVVFFPRGGFALFHSGDAGKTVTAQYSVIKLR